MHPVVSEAKSKMDKSVEAFQQELTNIRTGRANPAMLDIVDVEVYGSRMKINQLGSVSSPDPHMLVIDLWDKSQLGTVEKAIMSSPLGVTPSNDGRVIRVPIPSLTEERRRDLVKLAGKHVEEARVSVRSVRRTAIELLKKLQKDGELPEDDAHRLTEEVQHLTDGHISKVEDIFRVKEADIMEV